MNTKRSFILLVFITLGVSLAIVNQNGVIAQASSKAEPDGITVPFSWLLTDPAGKAVKDGVYVFSFALFDAKEGGTLLWSELQTDVSVYGGKVNVELGAATPIPASLVKEKKAQYWLAVSLRSAVERSFTDLSPRQAIPLSPQAPEALACPHSHFSDYWYGSNSGYGLWVNNTSTGDGIRTVSGSTSTNFASLWAVNVNTGTAVYGYSAGGRAGDFYSDTNFGVYAKGNDVSGEDRLGDIWLDGERGEILSGTRLNLSSNGYTNVDIDADNNDTSSKFYIYANNNTEVFSVDQTGHMVASGTKSAIVQTEDYGQRLLYAVESPEVLFEDVGTAALAASGETTVAFDPIFAETVNLSDYQVFITPLFDQPVILYVTDKTETGFTVKGVTLDGQPVSCSFDYRIVASRLGYEEVRLEAPDVTPQSVGGTK